MNHHANTLVAIYSIICTKLIEVEKHQNNNRKSLVIPRELGNCEFDNELLLERH